MELSSKTTNTSFLNGGCVPNKNRLSDSINFIPIVTLDLLVNGNADLTDETNLIMKRAVLRYIKKHVGSHNDLKLSFI